MAVQLREAELAILLVSFTAAATAPPARASSFMSSENGTRFSC